MTAQPAAPLCVLIVDGAVRLTGEIDFSNCDRLSAAVDQLTASRPRTTCDVVVQAGGVSFIDASGFGALVSISNGLAAHGARLRVVDPSPQLQRLSSICGLNAALGLDLNDDEAPHDSAPNAFGLGAAS